MNSKKNRLRPENHRAHGGTWVTHSSILSDAECFLRLFLGGSSQIVIHPWSEAPNWHPTTDHISRAIPPPTWSPFIRQLRHYRRRRSMTAPSEPRGSIIRVLRDSVSVPGRWANRKSHLGKILETALKLITCGLYIVFDYGEIMAKVGPVTAKIGKWWLRTANNVYQSQKPGKEAQWCFLVWPQL